MEPNRLKQLWDSLYFKVPEYRARWNLSARSIQGTVSFVASLALLWTVTALWQVRPAQEATPPRPIPASTGTPSPNSVYALDPASWAPQIADYGDESTYGTLPGYRETLGTRNPNSGDRAAVNRGKILYQRNCQTCHGREGRPNLNLRVPARDLSNPLEYRYGSSDTAIFRSISYGLPGSPMGRLKGQLSEQQLWDLTSFVVALQR